MNAVKPTPFTTPDGVERELRFTLGARRRILDYLGLNLKDALNKYDSAAFPEVLFALLHDDKGKPPDGITVSSLAESLPADSAGEILAAIYAAASNGRLEKNELEPLIRKAMTAALTGSDSGASVPSSSDSQTSNSGGDILNVKLMHESNGMPINSAAPTTEPESPQPQSTTSTET